jgi:hypothetical protein
MPDETGRLSQAEQNQIMQVPRSALPGERQRQTLS